MDGRGGNDTLGGEAGNDTLNGGAGNDVLVGAAGPTSSSSTPRSGVERGHDPVLRGRRRRDLAGERGDDRAVRRGAGLPLLSSRARPRPRRRIG